LTDLQMPGMTGLELIRELAKRQVASQVVMITAYASVATAVEAMRYGAFDYIEKPFDIDQLETLIARAIRQSATGEKRASMPTAAGNASPAMLGTSTAMQQLRQLLNQVAPTNETVLITGESGTGKELVARYLHAASRRASGAFVGLNCPALSPSLMESELFGHERGAFTSADAPRIGRFELADHGTLLLDEITEIELPLQAKLLRVLQERKFERVGSSATRDVDVRLVATTNRHLREEVTAGRFREDLYFRLAVVPVHVPPLRERSEDVPQLAEHFLQQTAARLQRPPCALHASAAALLCEYHWPGNVRELENLMTRAMVLTTSDEIRADGLLPWLERSSAPQNNVLAMPSAQAVSLESMERQMIETTLEKFDGHRGKTAEALGIGVRTLANKLRAYGYGPRDRSFVRSA
ncbi:MAG TPA: sigma-54 dependent transcriptional regulator, partial [Pirellulaceae bacterium]|nr:sigma-54 dependent transcriptional regulator [Pirellulaceae bacterium]